jgi:hypothetical protein
VAEKYLDLIVGEVALEETTEARELLRERSEVAVRSLFSE